MMIKHLFITAIAMLMGVCAMAQGLVGTDPVAGQHYYLYNIYQSKFLGPDNKLQAPNIGTPITFAASASGIDIGGTIYTATKKTSEYYQLTNGSMFFAFEDKQDDPNSPDDENRRLYVGGGITCQNTINDTDRSYWKIVSESEYAEWMAKKKITIASLNVDGMPASVKVAGIYTVNLNPDATEGPGATRIGNKLRESGFDVVGVSEDFNYHNELWNAAWNNAQGTYYNSTTHRGAITAGLGAVGDYLGQRPVLDSDGLCLFYRVGIPDQATLESTESWTAWNDHNGYTDQGGDGLIKKGWRYYVVRLADGTEIDLYTMHMDAESGEGDCNARASQLTQLVNHIKSTHNGRPIVIIGDSNCRYTRDKVKSNLIDAINADERFTIRDPWIMFGRNNTYPAYGTGSIMAASEGYLHGEVVDKIWFINNAESPIRLVAETYAQDLSFVDEDGSPLCDHKPCVVTFSYHDYDPVIDDVAIVETTADAVYLRNRENGRYLMNGGWWGSHAVVGNYAKPYYITSLPNGKYTLQSAYGYVNDGAYTDGPSALEFTILEQNGYKIFSWNDNGTQRALTANDPTYFNDNPLYRYATHGELNVNDHLQQWEIVTKEQLAAEMAQASALNPVNVTHLLASANFDRIDWNEHGKWTFDGKNNTNSGRVTDQGIGGPDNDAFCNYNRAISTKKTTSSANQWDCYQSITVPSGYYIISNQAVVNGVTDCVYFYAWSNPDGSQKEETLLIPAANANDFTGGYNQINAAYAFNQGKYVNTLPMIKVGTDGKLVVGVKKTKNNSTSGWTCFDNFQLIYLGTEKPAESYYIYNVEAGKWLTSGYDYDARAILGAEGKVWTPRYLSSGLSLQCEGKGGNLGIATDGLLGTFVDWRNAEPWHVEVDANGAFTLQQRNHMGNYIGWSSETYGDFVTDNTTATTRELAPGIHWTAMTAEQYNNYKTTALDNGAARQTSVAIYRSAHLSGIDVTEFEQGWSNPNTTAEQLSAQAEALKQAIELAIANDTYSERGYDMSWYINNANCGDEAFTGWDREGDWNSQLAVNPVYQNGDVALAPRFYEKYDGVKLPDAKISQTITGLPCGIYALSLDINAQLQSNTGAVVTGTYLYAKAGTKERTYVECDTHGEGIRIATFTTPLFNVAEGESVEIGLALENTNANWVAFDNWQLRYMGGVGDINRDGKLSVADLTALIDILQGRDTEEQFDHLAADVNSNGSISLSDVEALVDLLLKQK